MVLVWSERSWSGMAAAKTSLAWAHGLPLDSSANHTVASYSSVRCKSWNTLLALWCLGTHRVGLCVRAGKLQDYAGETRDDAVGEAHDKCRACDGRTLPKGREIDELAHKGKDIYDFPRAMMKTT